MTKERKIAIEMWEYIRDNYDYYREYRDVHENDEDYDGEDAIHNLKVEFLKGKGVNWAMNCWFCEYIGHRRHHIGIGRCQIGRASCRERVSPRV